MRKLLLVPFAIAAAIFSIAACVGDESSDVIAPSADAGQGSETSTPNDIDGSSIPQDSGGQTMDAADASDPLGPPPAAKGTLGAMIDLPDPMVATATAIDQNGNLVVVGTINGNSTLGTTPLSPVPGRSEGFIAKFSPAGAVLAANVITTATFNPNYKTGAVTPSNVSVAPNGELYVTGTASGTTISGAGANFFNAPATDGGPQPVIAFVLRAHATDLSIAWGTGIGPLSNTGQQVYGCPGIATREIMVNGAPVTRVIAGCNIGGALTVPPQSAQIASTYNAYGNGDIAIISLDQSSGKAAWVNVIGGTLAEEVDSVALDPNGDVIVGARYSSASIQNTLGDINESNGTIGLLGLVAKLKGDTGAKVWTHVFRASANPTSSDQPVVKVLAGADGHGNVKAAGIFQGVDVNFGKGAVSAGGTYGSMYFVGFDGTGAESTQTIVPLDASVVMSSFAIDPWGSTVVSGYLDGVLTLPAPNAPLAFDVNTEEFGPFLAKFDPNDKIAWIKRFTTTWTGDDHVDCYGAANVGPSGAIGYGGLINGTWVVDTKTINPTAGSAIDGGRPLDNTKVYGFAMTLSP